MADDEYRRLTCAVAACEGTHKARGYCLRHYRQWQRGGVKKDATCCVQCGEQFAPPRAGVMYCSKRCKMRQWSQTNPVKQAAHRALEKRPAATRCVYYAGYCQGCGAPDGRRRPWTWCEACAAERVSQLKREYNARLIAGRPPVLDVACRRCQSTFQTMRNGGLHQQVCEACAAEVQKAARRKAKATRRARHRNVERELFDPMEILERDGWVCQRCSRPTPREARGTHLLDAPEVDHIKPLAKGGPHTRANTQCLCRECNVRKADSFTALDSIVVGFKWAANRLADEARG